jgi:predicted helicase
MAGETVNAFEQVLQKYRDTSFSERDKGYRFERLMQSFLKTYPLYDGQFDSIWLWNEFPSRADFGSGDKDLGIDIVARTQNGDYWAVQCKCYQEDASIDKPKVDTFLSTSGKSFYDTLEAGKKVNFAYRLWIDTTKKGFNREADNTIQGQTPPVGRLGYYELVNAAVDWQKLDEGLSGKEASVKKHTPLPHQKPVITDVHNYLKKNDRGKLIMACGTGKTFTSLCIAEKETNANGLVLFLVPSIALLGQTLREWKNHCIKPVHAICICSDSGVSKTDDVITATITDLALPASTNIKNIARQFEAARDFQKTDGGNIVVFSTYQSIDVISEVQKIINRQKKDSFLFDLVICDEAHRTTGVKLSGGDESAFIKVHDDKFIKAKKRIYMTATPRIYSEAAQKKAKEAFATLCSMDDPAMYGEEMYRIGFGEAVDKQLLSDYKVIVLTVAENQLDEKFKKSIEEKSKAADIEINAEDTLKIIGCINALSKKSLTDKELFEGVDPAPMRSAVAFNQNIAVSKATAESFNISRDVYFSTLTEQQRSEIVAVEAAHVDGTMGAQTREAKLHWLKSADPAKRECNILNNVRCLSEGVDIPSLDAVMFLSARNSQIDVVQSVGRVMRKDKEGKKKYGYIIIPVVVPPEAEPEKVLSSDRFKVVWTVLNALRAHDDRFDATINKIELNKKKPSQIRVTGTNIGGEDPFDDGEGSGTGAKIKSEFEKQLELEFARLQGLIYARIVKKCGTKPYWEEWAKDIAKIAERHIENITAIVGREGKAKAEFEKYISGLRKNINPSVTEADAIEMLAQHIITKPVFEALFEDYSFVKNNTVSKSLQGIIDALNEQSKKEDAKKLERFYVSVQQKAEGIDNSEAKQKIIVELYDKFFRTAFPQVTERLGIVYTPVEIVDFIIHSVEDVLQKEFGRSMTDENVHILDPFTGTGTFITRLLQSGIIKNEDLKRKYTKELHANEIVLLAYYIASINIENVYHDQLRMAEPYNTAFFPVEEKIAADVVQFPGTEKTAKKGEEYTPFPGICLTDTFQLGETKEGENLFSEIFPQNSQRVQEQQKTSLRVIMGNPPYSRGQDSINDDAKNQSYPKLENRIKDTYAENLTSGLQRDLYNSYIKAFRWSSDRIDPKYGGIIAFISNNGWIDKNYASGLRKTLEIEFDKIYIYNLRGGIRGLSREEAKRQGDNVFNITTGVGITFFVKSPNHISKASVSYYAVDDYLTRANKLNQLKEIKSLYEVQWENIQTDIHGDWLHKRNNAFLELIPLEPNINKDNGNKQLCFFFKNPIGISSNRKDWVYNFSVENLTKNIKNMTKFYDLQRKLFKETMNIDMNPVKIKWTENLIKDAKDNVSHAFKNDKFIYSLYSPFTKTNLYYYKPFIERPGKWEEIFPYQDITNLIIITPGKNNRKDFCALITNLIPDLNNFDGGTQCFPLYWYEKKDKVQGGLFERVEEEYTRRDAISDFILDQAKTRYGPKVTREDIFYYVYGILHSPDYRKTFANDLKKMLPRLPLVENQSDFQAFSEAGKALAKIHLEYEEQGMGSREWGVDLLFDNVSSPFPIPNSQFPIPYFVVDTMKFPAKNQKDTIIYNSHITISNIPAKAYEYVVNGKSAIEWVIERYAITIHKESGIKNDPNDWAREHENPQYILDLLLSVITVSIKTVDIVAGLPKVEWE